MLIASNIVIPNVKPGRTETGCIQKSLMCVQLETNTEYRLRIMKNAKEAEELNFLAFSVPLHACPAHTHAIK